MKEVAIDVRSAYRSSLVNNISHDGSIVPVYGKIVLPDAPMPYIYFPDQETSNASSKDQFSNEHYINIEIVYSSQDGDGDWISDAISMQIKSILAVLDQIDYPSWGSNFHFVEVEFESDRELKHFVKDHWVFRKILVFRNIIDEV